MCEFISWIERLDSDGEIQYLYLTDRDIFSKEGRRRLTGLKDNDFLGHGAIRAFYADPDGNPLEGGKNCEVRDFWDTKKLPRHIALKIADFDKYWGRVFKLYFQNDDLRYIVCNAPPKWKSKAFEQLLNQNPTNDDLSHIVCYAPPKWKSKAFEQLLSQNPTNNDLWYIVFYAPPKWKSKAFEQLLSQNPTNNDLWYIICYASYKWKAKAQAILDSRKKVL